MNCVGYGVEDIDQCNTYKLDIEFMKSRRLRAWAIASERSDNWNLGKTLRYVSLKISSLQTIIGSLLLMNIIKLQKWSGQNQTGWTGSYVDVA